MKYDFFIAHSSADNTSAKKLCWALKELKRTVFLDLDDLSPGQQWDEELRNALIESSVILVLVSPNSLDSYYEREEILRAIEQARDDPAKYKVVPIMLEGALSEHIPYGLKVAQSVSATNPGTFDQAAMELDEEFPVSDEKEFNRRRNAYYALGAALRLDRVKEWSGILEASQVPENTLFLYHGSHQQNVGLFLERIQRFYSQEMNQRRKVIRVPFNIQGQTPRTGSDWSGHLRDALNAGSASLSAELKRTVQQQPIFVILGVNPLMIDLMNDDHLSGLQDFLTKRLPNLIREARLDQGIAVIVPLDYEEFVPDRIEKFEKWGEKAEESGLIIYRPLKPAQLPTWEEVKDYLDEQRPRLSTDQIDLIQNEYEKRVTNPDLTFEQLARMIDRYTLTG